MKMNNKDLYNNRTKIITDLKVTDVDEGLSYWISDFPYNTKDVFDPSDKPIEVEHQIVHGIPIRSTHNGTLIVGWTDVVREYIGEPFLAYNEFYDTYKWMKGQLEFQRNKNSQLNWDLKGMRSRYAVLNDRLDTYRKAPFWKRVKYLFTRGF